MLVWLPKHLKKQVSSMQFLPVSDPRSFSLPVIGAMLIVVSILVLMSTNWMNTEAVSIHVPKHISAKLVQIDKPKPKTVKKPIKKPAPKINKPKPAVKPVKPVVINKDKVIPLKPEPIPAKKEPLPLPGADFSQALAEEEKMMNLNALNNEEERAQQAEKDEEAVANYVGQITALIQSVWRFPPSAKHEEVVLLRIYMVPTGEVTEVQVVESSGNIALDRSAEQAVWKVAKFPVPKDAVLFEAQFRKFLIKLTPENARL